MSFKDNVSTGFSYWRSAITGKEGLLSALVALAIFAFCILVVSALVVVLPFLAHITLFTLFVLVTVLALAPTVIRFAFAGNFKNQHFTLAKGNQVTLNASAGLVLQEINLTTSFTNIKVNWVEQEVVSVELNTDYGTLDNLKYLWEEKEGTLNFTQGGGNNKIQVYNLVLNLPKSRTDLVLNARLVEGSFSTEGEGCLKTLRVEAVNSTIGLAGTKIETCKLYGLNLMVNVVALKVATLVVRTTGGSFNLGIEDNNRGARLKITTALSTLKVNDIQAGKSFRAETIELWPPVNVGDGYMDFEFNLLNATVEMNH